MSVARWTLLPIKDGNVLPVTVGTSKLTVGLSHADKKLFEKSKLAVGITESSKLNDIRWENMVNGVAYVFPRDNLRPNVGSYGRYESSYACVYVTCAKYDVAIHVMPLSLVTAVCDTNLPVCSNFDLADFRLFYYWGIVPGYNDNLSSDSWRRLNLKTPRAPDVTLNPRRQIIVSNGKIVSHKTLCMQCPKKVEWSLGLCAPLCYNCKWPDYFASHMRTALDPDFEALFGKKSFSEPKDCVVRKDFSGYYANDVADPDYSFELIHEKLKNSSNKAVITKRLKRNTCKVCLITNLSSGKISKGNVAYCGQTIINCDGPFLAKDIPSASRINPWEYHVLFNSGLVIQISKIRSLFNYALHNKRANFSTLLPVSIHNQEFKARNTPLGSIKSKVSDRLVSIYSLQITRMPRLVLAYREWCDLLELPRVNSFKDLVKQVPYFNKIKPKVHMVLYYWLNKINRICVNMLYFTIRENEATVTDLYSRFGNFGNSVAKLRSSNDVTEVYNALAFCQPDHRKEENLIIKSLAGEATKDFVSLSSVLASLRKLNPAVIQE